MPLTISRAARHDDSGLHAPAYSRFTRHAPICRISAYYRVGAYITLTPLIFFVYIGRRLFLYLSGMTHQESRRFYLMQASRLYVAGFFILVTLVSFFTFTIYHSFVFRQID